MAAALRSGLDWLLRDRTTGEYVVAQWPNVPLIVFLVARALQWLLSPAGTAATLLHAAGSLALAWWAGDELLRGVNPFRRLLGALVLVSLALSLLHR